MIISIQQAYDYAIAAGFNHENAITIVGIAMAESGLDTEAKGYNPPSVGHSEGTLDRGVLQLNDYWQRDYNDACAYDAACSFKAAWDISEHATTFWSWITFRLGKHGAYLAEIRAVVEKPQTGVQTVSIEVPQSWVSEVSVKLGIGDPTVTTPTPEHKTYIIEAGDTLSGIAEKLHGNAEDWHALYEANKETIGDNPDLIEVGMTLVLPEGW
jgi:LysM repeat protein